MEIYSEILGNIYHDQEWMNRAEECMIKYIDLDQWTAQKSGFLVKDDTGKEYPIALKRGEHVNNGDVIYYSPEKKEITVLRLNLSSVLVISLDELAKKSPENIIHISVELGHAIGNQHWPAVIKGTKVFVPLTVDKKVMMSVMETHHIEDISYEFQNGQDIIPYLAPHEIRRLFGGSGHESHSHDDKGHIQH